MNRREGSLKQIFVDKSLTSAFALQNLKVPIYNDLPNADGGVRGNVIFNIFDNRFYGSDGITWFPLGGGAGREDLEETLSFGNTTGPYNIVLSNNAGTPAELTGQNILNTKGTPVTLRSGLGGSSAGDIILNLNNDFVNDSNVGSLIITKPTVGGVDTGVHIYAVQRTRPTVTGPEGGPGPDVETNSGSDTCGVISLDSFSILPNQPFISGQYLFRYVSQYREAPVVILSPQITTNNLLNFSDFTLWIQDNNSSGFNFQWKATNVSPNSESIRLRVHYHALCPNLTS
jgi:hypothetical protein